MPKLTSPFGKYPAELIATKSNKIFTFAKEETEELRENSAGDSNTQKGVIRSRSASPQLSRPGSRMSSFYNGYSSPLPGNQEISLDLRQGRGSAMARSGSLKRSGSPSRPRSESPSIIRTESLKSKSSKNSKSPANSPNNLTRSDSPNCQSDCTEENCLNLFHQHNLNKSPRSNYSSPSSTSTKRLMSRDSVMTSRDNVMTSHDSVMTSCDNVMTSRDSGVISRTPSPSKDAAIRDMDKFYKVEGETLTGLGESVNVTELDKISMLLAHNIAPLFPELTDETVTIERVLEVWEEKGLKDSTDRSIIEFLKRVDNMSRGENQIIPQILCYNVEAILTSNEVESDSLRESAIAAFKSVITTLQSNLAQVQYDMDALSVALERRTEELEKNLHEYEIGLDLEHKKSDEKLRVQKEAFRQTSLQLEKEGELKVEKLNSQMDGIIKRTDKEIKNLKNEEANLKKMMSEQNEDIRLTKKYLHEAQNELIKYDELQDAYKMVVEEYQKLHRAMEEKQRQHCEEQENIDELKRYREETSEENKRLRDQMDELHAKFSACKMKLEKEEKNARNAAKRLKKAQQKLQDQTGDSLAVDKRHQMRQRMSVAVPMFTKEADPSLAPTIDTELEDSLNDEILDSESNNVLELQEEVWRLQEEVDNQNFEMERYGRILMKQEEELENLREKDNNEENSEDAALPLVEVTDVGEVGCMVSEAEVTIVQERVSKLESTLKENSDQLGLAEEAMKSKGEEIESLMAEKIKKDEEIQYLMGEKENLQEKLENKEKKEEEEKKNKEKEEDSLQSQLTSLQDQVSLLNGTLELNASEIESLESQLEENGRVISSYEDSIEEKHSLSEQCRAELSACKEEFEKANENIGQLTEQVQRIEHERAVDMEQHKHKVTVLESAILKLEEEKTASTARATELAALQDKSLVSGDLIRRLQTTVTDLSAELENTKCALDEAETECTKLKEQGLETENEKEEENQTLNTELVEMKEMLNEHFLKLDTVEKEKTELSLIVAQMKQEKNESESQVKLQEEKLSELDRVKGESEIQVKLLERKLSEQTQETEVGRVEKSALADELASTQNMLAEREEKLAETSNQLEAAEEEIETQRAHRNKEKGELEHILESKEGEIETLKSHLDQVENDYEALVDSLNKETDNRVSELQNQLEETAGDISSLKCQLKDLGQQLVVLSGERERFYNDNCKLRVDNERLGEEKELLITKVEEVKAVRDTLELDIEQQVAEYQDMMKCCANLQQQNMSSSSRFQPLKDYIKDLEDASFELNEKTTQLEQAEKEKEDIIQLFEDKIREKEGDLERSILEKSEMEGRAKETEVELSRTKSSNTTLDDVKKSLEQQLTAVIKSLDDLTERYEIENSFLEEKVVESINEVKEVQHQAEETLHDQLTEQKEKMYEEFREEMKSIKEKHESAISGVRDQTSTAMSEYKRKCEKKMREMKERYTEDTDSKDGVISGLRDQLVEKSNYLESEISKLKEIFSQDKSQLINSLSSDKDKLLNKINQISEDKIKQLEETHKKDAEIFGEKMRNLQTTCDRFEKEGKEMRERLLETSARLQDQIETITEANSKSESSFKLEISDLKVSGVKKEDEVCRLQDKVTALKEKLALKQQDMEQSVVELSNLASEHSRQVSTLLSQHKKELEDLSQLHGEAVQSMVEKNCDILQEMEKKNLSERKCLVSEYNDLIESIKIEQKEEAEIQKVRHEEIQRDLQKKNEDLEEEKKESAEKNEDLVATLDESRIVLREKDQEIDILNEEIFKIQEDNVRTLQDHDQELSALETERKEMISSFREKETKLLEEVENVRESSFVEIEGTVAGMAEQREMYQDLSQKYEQLQMNTVDKTQHDKIRGRLAVLMATLRAEQAVSRERATQVNELMGIKTGLEAQLDTLQSALKSDNSHLLKQLSLQHQQDQDSREDLVRHYKTAHEELEKRLDHVVNEHSQCHNMRRKIQSLKQQLAVEKTAQNPNTELAQKVETSAVQIQSLEKQVTNLERANTKLESSVTKLMEENADLVERLNNTEHQIHLALQETIKTKSQKVAICKVLENVVNVVTTAA